MGAILTWAMSLTFIQLVIASTLAIVLSMALLWGVVFALIKLIQALAQLIDKANIKKISLQGVECFDDKPVVKKATKRAVKK